VGQVEREPEKLVRQGTPYKCCNQECLDRTWQTTGAHPLAAEVAAGAKTAAPQELRRGNVSLAFDEETHSQMLALQIAPSLSS